FGSCGGCAWQHVAYDTQLEAKAAIVREAFTRIGGWQPPGPVPITPSPSVYGYRLRARVRVESGRVGFRRRRSNALCATRHCPILVPALQQKLAEVADAAPGRDDEWELFAAATDARATPLPTTESRRLELVVAGERIGVSPGVFAQSNASMLEPLARSVVDAAGSGDVAFDLFAGAGFFTLGLARRFQRVLALESDVAAVRDLEANLREAERTNVDVVCMALEAALGDGALSGRRPDVVVVDPPRTGLPPGSSDALAELGPRRIVYLSCDPATQARDVAYLIGNGYRVERVEAFDLFPQTPHVESLAVLARDSDQRTVRVR
ncbi:MAG: class I SAM-dependent RNA methyltransferase, partial [Myxococcota bacterium]